MSKKIHLFMSTLMVTTALSANLVRADGLTLHDFVGTFRNTGGEGCDVILNLRKQDRYFPQPGDNQLTLEAPATMGSLENAFTRYPVWSIEKSDRNDNYKSETLIDDNSLVRKTQESQSTELSRICGKLCNVSVVSEERLILSNSGNSLVWTRRTRWTTLVPPSVSTTNMRCEFERI